VSDVRQKPGYLAWNQVDLIDRLSPGEVEALPFGAIRLDSEGKILSYNAAEAKLADRDPKKVVGKNFFTEVAPCTNVQEFAGRFHEGFAAKDLNAVFPYRFLFPTGHIDVWVRLFYSQSTGSAWVFVSQQADGTDS
jgi:photoactive yellow protein